MSEEHSSQVSIKNIIDTVQSDDNQSDLDSQSSGETIYDSDDETTTQLKEPVVFTEDEIMSLNPTHEKLPSKLKHIKNLKFLNNTYNPLTGKYVKDVWAFKRTKLDRIKRDLIWTYFRHRKNKLAAQSLRETYYKNIKTVMIIHFDDPTQVRFELTEHMVQILKHYCHEKEIKKPKKNKDKKNKKKELKELKINKNHIQEEPADSNSNNSLSDSPKEVLPKSKPEYRLLWEQKKAEKRERKLKEKMEGKVVKKGKPSKYAGRVKNTDKYNKKKILATPQLSNNNQQQADPQSVQPTNTNNYQQVNSQPIQPINTNSYHPDWNNRNNYYTQPSYYPPRNQSNTKPVPRPYMQQYSANNNGYYPRNTMENNNQQRSYPTPYTKPYAKPYSRQSSQDNHYPRPYPRQPTYENYQTKPHARPPRHDQNIQRTLKKDNIIVNYDGVNNN